MEILHLCPASLATGGTEGIHNLVHHLNKAGADAKILYVGKKHNPQPQEYKKYECEYLTEFPNDFEGCVIFPEVWANQVNNSKYKKCLTAVNWQGVDVFYWHNGVGNERFLHNKNTLHIVNSEYAFEHLKQLGIIPVKISDCLSDIHFEEFEDKEERSNDVLFNPVSVKLTQFQKDVMSGLKTDYGIKFVPITGYTQEAVRQLFRQHKLYIDFGVFSGRERLPREAVMGRCCILTSNKGTAAYYKDNSIPDKYKCSEENQAMNMTLQVLNRYKSCVKDFDEYRRLLREDKRNYLNEVTELYNEIFHHYTSL